jgi:5-methylthioadenosine/S-adenosylhomocysteine deaminase
MSEDMFQTMAIGSMLYRTGRRRDTEGGVTPPPQDVPAVVTRDAADSVGLGAETGSIAVGMPADLTLIDMNTPAMRPAIRPLSNIVHDGHPGVVHSVMADGVFLMRDRRVLSLDEDALLAEAREVTRRVWERMVADNPDIAPPEGGLRWGDV